MTDSNDERMLEIEELSACCRAAIRVHYYVDKVICRFTCSKCLEACKGPAAVEEVGFARARGRG